ncbi:NUDIX hydrolase [Paenibacillus rhizovicinus]|uniref:NUDIX hydrolase n=1 Tax=Paenibacillus rhizovicinus TaxID=2704463 RepID=A0A6C0NUU7_9BACL|nr:NUDIX hydrolase [Paenibacillus rhizovicinus]QHW29706.1 NUDIX hydrolase [Paenibacillus rhizovicinus]
MFFVNARAIVERIREGKTEIIIQTRNKPGEPKQLELPGGQIEMFESLTDALRREVKEETGLDVTWIEGEDTRIDTQGINPEVVVECVRPFAAYQTIRGGIDSVGYYFVCRAEGELLKEGDCAQNPRWIAIDELAEQLHRDPLQFLNIDCAAIKFYLKHRANVVPVVEL